MGRAGRAERTARARALQAFKRLENCPFFAQSQKGGWNNGRRKKRRKSGKGRKSGTR